MASRAVKKNTDAVEKTVPIQNTKSSGGSRKAAASKSGDRKKAADSAASSVRTPKAAELPREEPEHMAAGLLREAALWLMLAACVFLYISYFGFGGYFGGMVSDLCFGCFGFPAYFFPALLFVAATFLVSNRGSRIAGVKFAASVGLYLTVCGFFGLFSGYAADSAGELLEYYRLSAAQKRGGGLLGGLLCRFLGPALGTVGTGILLAILAIICLLLITQRSLMRSVQDRSRAVYESARRSSERKREQEERAGGGDFPEAEEPHFPQVERELYRQDRNRDSGSGKGTARKEKKQTSRLQRPEKHTVTQAAQRPFLEGTELAPGMDGAGEGGLPQAGRRTEIEIPVIFPANPRESRLSHKVRGVTTDTKLTGDSGTAVDGVQEFQPKCAPEGDADSLYLDLDRTAGQEGQPEMGLRRDPWEDGGGFQEETPALHIEGIQEEKPLMQEHAAEEPLPWEEPLEMEQEEPSRPSERGKGDEEWPCGEPDVPAERTAGGGGAATGKVPAGQREAPSPEKEGRQAAAPGGPKKNPRSSQKEIAAGIASVEAEISRAEEAVKPEYVFPPLSLLKKGKSSSLTGQEQEVRRTAAKLQQTLNSFGVHVTVTNVSCGPSVTRYELLPEQGVKVSRIVSLADDIKLNLAAADIRIEAPIPGKSAVGIEVPNSENSTVMLRDLLESDEFKKHKSKLAFAAGKDIGGKVVVADIAKMPHLLIAGATGSGKSVCINTLIMSILYKADPEEVKLIMIDPKVVELSVYNGIPHLYIPVVTDPKKAAGALNWGVAEMTDRYNKFAEMGVRDLKGYNQRVEALSEVEDPDKPKKLPQIVIIVDELADLMMVAPGEVEDSICRLAQLARAAGIHLIIATQRPSVNVITGLIKANMPSRIAFSVSSGVDSRTIIDMNGAEKLLGKGDMLFYPQGYQKPARVQGAFVSDEEVADVVDFLKNKNSAESYDAQMEEQIAKVQQAVSAAKGSEDVDELFADAGKFIIEKDKASIGMLQRVFKIGFNRAARIMDQLSEAGVVGPEEGTKPRKILMSPEQFENYLEEN